jgi:Astacin (Peptidase family M12A)
MANRLAQSENFVDTLKLTGAKDQFEKYQTNNLGMPYDYESVMHYKWNYFSISWGQPTIISNDKGRKVDMGNRKAMTALDVEKINRWYKSECDQREEHDRSSRAEHPSDRPSLAHPSNDTPPITRDSTSPFSVEKPSLKSSASRNIIFLEFWMILFIVISYVSMSFFL